MKLVAGVEEYQIPSFGVAYALVHGVVQAVIGFGYNFPVFVGAVCYQLECGVFRRTVDDNVLVVGVCLAVDTRYSTSYSFGGVVAHRDY